MRVLLVKMSSLGDLVHLLPALTEATRACPEVRFDWLVEPDYAEVAGWHPSVDQVIRAPLRRWRRAPLAALREGGPQRLRQALRARKHDLVIDAQGLIKSAVLAAMVPAERVGLDANSVRERQAAWFYQRRIAVPRTMHAVDRLRRLLAFALGYEACATPGPTSSGEASASRYGLCQALVGKHRGNEICLLPGTTWPNKHWPEAHWCALAELLAARGHPVAVPWGNPAERVRAERIAAAGRGEVIPRGDLTALLARLGRARGVVGVDSGPLHMAAAAGTPGVALYGPTDPRRTGPWGASMRVLTSGMGCEPCLARHCTSGEAVRLAKAGNTALEPPCLGRLEPGTVDGALASVLGAG